MKTKSVNSRTISARIIGTPELKGENENVVRFKAVHHVGSDPLFLNCVMFANKGKKNERALPMDKLTPNNNLVLKGFDKPTSWEKDGKKYTGVDFVVTSIEEPEIIADSEPAAEEEETEGSEE